VEPLYGLAKVLLRRPLRHGLRWAVEGVERIPAEGPVLLASNHISYFDPLCICYVADLAGRKARFLAKAELFESWWFGPMMRQVRSIPVARGTGDASSLDAATAALAAGELVVVFPEGTISPELEPMAGKTGVARLARTAGVPVLPLGLWGSHRVIPPSRRKPSRRRGVAIAAVVGEPVMVGSTDNPRESTDRIMAAVCACVRRARSIYPQVPRGDADAWWVRPPEGARLRSCRGRVTQQLIDEAAGLAPPSAGG
jgi:1-acyl-sn-glycerol-3-phosphate acyltransferase